MTLIMLFQIKC